MIDDFVRDVVIGRSHVYMRWVREYRAENPQGDVPNDVYAERELEHMLRLYELSKAETKIMKSYVVQND